MLEFLARNSIWLAIVVIALVLAWERRIHAQRLRDRLPEVALQAAGVFLAVALAFEQTSYDRRQQRLSDAQTLAISGALSLALALEDLARPVRINYDARPSESWFAVPPVLDKMLADEKFLASLDIQSVRRIARHVSEMRASNEKASHHLLWDKPNPTSNPDRSWKRMSCELNRLVGEHLLAASGVMTEVCSFLRSSGQELPEFLAHSDITSRTNNEAVFRVNQCKITMAILDGSYSQVTVRQVDAAIAGTPEDCSEP